VQRRQVWLLVALIAIGTGIRLWIAFTNYGWPYDVGSGYAVARQLVSHPLHVYSVLRWPYPAGYLPVVLLCREIAHVTGAAFWAVWKVPAVLCDAGIAALVASAVTRFGGSPRERLVATALVALGPSFILISGYHGQIDSAMTLAALAGVVIWCLESRGRRAWQAGILIGLGASIKQPAFFMVLALLPTARSWREARTLLACSVGVPVLSVIPFLAADAGPTWHSLTHNQGVPGIGGLSLLLQPGLVHTTVRGEFGFPNAVNAWFYERQNWIVGLSVLAGGLFAYRKRLDPIPAAALIWLTVYVSNFNWSYQYFVWGLPFFLLAGWRARVATIQLGLLLPAAELYFRFGVPGLTWLYLPLVMCVWVACAFWLAAGIVRPSAAVWAAARGTVRS
jgi:Glycosyltransferase family 87